MKERKYLFSVLGTILDTLLCKLVSCRNEFPCIDKYYYLSGFNLDHGLNVRITYDSILRKREKDINMCIYIYHLVTFRALPRNESFQISTIFRTIENRSNVKKKKVKIVLLGSLIS